MHINIEENLKKVNDWQKLLSSYRMALTLMSVDGQDAPPEGAVFRTERRALLAGEYQKLRSSKEIYDVLTDLAAAKDRLPDEPAVRTVELLLREMDREMAVPPEEASEYQRILSASIRAWPEAKASGDFISFAPYLKEVIEKYRQITELGMYGSTPSELSPAAAGCPERRESGANRSVYDCMLERHEEGWNTARYDRFFDGIKENILPLLQEILRRQNPSPSDSVSSKMTQYSGVSGAVSSADLLKGSYPVDLQREAMQKINQYLGFTDSWGRMSESEHPLTSPLCAGDVRFTTKFRDYNFALAVLSTVHETGHAYHAHGIDPAFEGTVLAYPGAALSESQSRFCENHLCRSEAFWEVNLGIYKRAFPREFERMRQVCCVGSFPAADVTWFLSALNAVRPGPLRLEADEVTYPIHILIRYELEKEMFDGKLQVADLEEAWNEKYRHYLGVCPGNAGEGVLQDMHWPWGYFGYFPTYALGSAYAAQFYAAAEKELDIPQLLRESRYPEIMSWLRGKIHRYGALYPADELLRRATGESFNPRYYFRYLTQKYTF